MKKYEYTDDIYKDIDVLISELRALGCLEIADRMHLLIHKVAWTTCSELFEELLKPLNKALESSDGLKSESIVNIKGMVDFMKRHLNQ